MSEEKRRTKYPFTAFTNELISSTTPYISNQYLKGNKKYMALFICAQSFGAPGTLTITVQTTQGGDLPPGDLQTIPFYNIRFNAVETAIQKCVCYVGKCPGRNINVKVQAGAVGVLNNYRVSVKMDFFN